MNTTNSGFALRRIADPAVEPISLEEAKLHCRVDHDEEDSLIEGFIVAAREHAENYLRRALVQQDWRLTLDRFPGYCFGSVTGTIELPRPPAIAILSISYVDQAGVTRELDEYQLDAEREPARLRAAVSSSWPSTLDAMNAVTIEYRAGYMAGGTESPSDPAANIPMAIKSAIKLHIGHLFENREQTVLGVSINTLPMGYEALMAPYRIYGF